MTTPDLPDDVPRRRSFARWLLQKRWRLTRSLTLGGQVCVIGADRSVLLVRHGYQPGWHFPGGGIELGENVLDAALRELREETGIVTSSAPELHGIFNNFAVFPGDHVILYIVRAFQQGPIPPTGFEIAERRFFAVHSLPPGTTAGTRRRIAEIFDQAPIVAHW